MAKRSSKESKKELESLRNQSDALGRQQDKNYNDILSSTNQVADAQKLINDLTREHNKLLKEGRKEQAGSVKAEYDAVKLVQDKAKLLNKTKQQFSGINKEVQNLAGSLQSMVEKLPGGKQLSKLFGVDKLGTNFESALNKSAKVFLKTSGSIGARASAAFSSFGPNLLAAVNPLTIIAVLVAGVVAAFLTFEKKAKGVAEATGLTLQQSKALVVEAKDVAINLGLQLATSTDILAVQKSTIKEFGIANMLSAEQAGNIAEIGKAFSIGAEAASKVTNEFMRMGMTGDDAATALLDVSAAALKAGVSVGAVTADIANSAKEVSKFFGGNVESLKKAAIQAAKLGVSLKTMANVSEGLLDFENSISSQFEFQALTGKMINMDAARELALRGDIAGATKSVLDQVGSIAEFDNMSYLARKALAAATGMSVDELQKSLTIQSKLGDLSAEQQASMANMGLSASQLKNMSADELKNKLAQQQATDSLSKSFSAMKDDFTKALIPAGEALVEIFSALSPIFKVLGGIIKIAFMPITLAGNALSYLVDLGREFSKTTAAIAVGTGLILANKQKTLILQTAIGTKAAIEQGIMSVKLLIQQKLNMAKLREGAIGVKNMAKEMVSGAMVLASAVAKIFSSFAAIPFGIGIPLAIAAAGGLFSMFSKAKSTGDLGIDPNGGPIVASPREGGIFQGTKNDGVSMSPSHGAGGGGGGGDVAAAIAQTNTLLRQLISLGTVIEMDGQLVGQVIRTSDSFRRK